MTDAGIHETAPILWAVDRPADAAVTSHSGRVCRFRGWALSTSGQPVTVRIEVDGRAPVELVPGALRPDVAARLSRDLGRPIDPAIGWAELVRLPRFRGPTLEASVSVTDGVDTTDPPARFSLLRDPELRALDTFIGDSPVLAATADRHLAGEGIEFGALHQPLRLDPSRCRVRYADRMSRADALEIFTDVATDYADQVVEPEFLIDLDRSDLVQLRAHHFDFFIANGVIEHLANPLHFLERVGALMEPGALLFLSVPDRDFTFDARRPITSRRHLWREYRAGVTEVSDAHLEEAIRASSVGALPDDPDVRRRVLDAHRTASVHVHVWDQPAFDALLQTAVARFGLEWETVEFVAPEQADGSMVYVLRALGDRTAGGVH